MVWRGTTAEYDVDGAGKIGRNLESSSNPAIRDSFAETFKQTFKMSHPFPEHHHFDTQRLNFAFEFALNLALSVQDETGQADADQENREDNADDGKCNRHGVIDCSIESGRWQCITSGSCYHVVYPFSLLCVSLFSVRPLT